MRARLASSTLLLAGFILLAPAGQSARGDEEETQRLLSIVRRDDDREAWRDAVERLKAGTPAQREALRQLLARLAKQRYRPWTTATARYDALAGKLEVGARAERRLLAWEEARAHANDWIFDTVRFPVPEQVVITGPMEGYREAKARGDLAIQAWNALRRDLERALGKAHALSPRRARDLREAHREAEDAFRRVADELPAYEREAYPPPPLDPLAPILLQLRLGEFAPAAETYAAMSPGWRRVCLFYAYAEGVMAWNASHPFGMRRDAVESIVCINEYRVALGISPVSHNERLARMAMKHSEEMTKLGYFSHRSPVPERETKEMRAKLEGYDAHVVECITGIGSGQAAVEFWKYDGGHHRDMVDPKWVEGGFGTRGPATYDGGAGEPGAIPCIRY